MGARRYGVKPVLKSFPVVTNGPFFDVVVYEYNNVSSGVYTEILVPAGTFPLGVVGPEYIDDPMYPF
jgi:hypothetical protein